MGDSSKFKGDADRRTGEEDETREPQIFDPKPRGLWQQLDGKETRRDSNRPRGMWDWVNARANDAGETQGTDSKVATKASSTALRAPAVQAGTTASAKKDADRRLNQTSSGTREVSVPDALKLEPGPNTGASSAANADAAPVTASLEVVAPALAVVSNDLRHVVATRVRGMDWPILSKFPRLEIDDRRLDAALVEPLLAALGDFDAKRLASLLHPQDLGTTVAPYLTKDPKQLPPVVGTLVAQAIHGVLGASVPRMAQRMVDVADAMYAAKPGEAPKIRREQLITSHPMDCVVADALIASGAFVAADADILSGKRKPPRVGLRDIQLQWLTGAQWNVVRAAPADASPEEVMAKLYSYARYDKDAPGGPTSYYAYGVAAAAPYFSLPASWAIQFPEAKANAPATIRDGRLPDSKEDSIEVRLQNLATSNVGDEIAFHEATPTTHPLPRASVQRTLDEIFVQLDHLRGVFAPWGLSGPVTAEGVHVAILSGDLAKASPARLAMLGAIFDTQRDRLHAISDSMAALDRAVATIGPRAYRPSDPLYKVASTFANAAGSSHLGQTSAYLIAQAEAEQRAITLRSIQSNEAALEQALAGEQLVSAGSGTTRQHSPAVGRTQNDLQQLENSLIGGGNVSPEQLERAQLSAQELSLNMRAHSLQAQIDQLEEVWRKGSVGMVATIVTTQKYRDIGPVGLVIHQALGEVRLALKPAELAPGAVRDKVANDLAGRRAAVATAQSAFERLAKDHDLANFFNDAYKTVRNQQIRTLIVQAAVMLGISLASAGIGGMVAEAMGETYMAAEGAAVAELSFGARTAVQVGSMATEVVGNATGQTVTSNTPFARALVDNAAFVLGAAGGAKLLEGIMQNAPAAAAFSKALDKELALIASSEERSANAMRELAKLGAADAGAWALKQGVAITGHTVMGMAIGYVVERVHQYGNAQPSSAQLGDWLVQGASVALGRMFHAALGERMPSYARLAKQSGLRRGNELYQQALAAHQRAAALGPHSDPAATLAVLNDAIRLHEATLEVLDEASRIPLGKGGPTHEQIEALKADAHGQLDALRSGEMLELRWKLHGLDSLGGGIRAGPQDRVDAAVKDVRELGLPIRSVRKSAEPNEPARWKIDGQEVELRVLEGSRLAPKRATPGPEHDLPRDVQGYLAGAEQVILNDVERLKSENAAQLADLLRTYKEKVVEYLRYNPARNLADLSKSLADEAKQVREHVDGLYTAIPESGPGESTPAPGWKLTVQNDDTEWSSKITDPSGKSLSIERGWDPTTGTLTMDTAFGAPKMDMVPTTPALIGSKGKTPAMAYANLHQMRAMGIPYGKGLKSSPLKTIKMSTIQNIETIGHLRWLSERYPDATLDELIIHTASFRYAEDIATQAGYRVVGQYVDSSSGSIPLKRLLEHYENDATSRALFQQDGKDRANVHDKMLGEYGIDGGDVRKGKAGNEILTNFNIFIFVEPLS